MVKKVRREVRTSFGRILPKALPSIEQREMENRQATTTFFGCGGHRHFDEPPDPTEVESATTEAEWEETQKVNDHLLSLSPHQIDPALSPEDNLIREEVREELGL